MLIFKGQFLEAIAPIGNESWGKLNGFIKISHGL